MNGTGTSLDTQERSCREFVAAEGWRGRALMIDKARTLPVNGFT